MTKRCLKSMEKIKLIFSEVMKLLQIGHDALENSDVRKFHPQNVKIGLSNTDALNSLPLLLVGNEPVKSIFTFCTPGTEDFCRAEEKNC